MQSQLVKQILKGDSVRLVQQFAELFLKRRIMKYPIEVKGSRYKVRVEKTARTARLMEVRVSLSLGDCVIFLISCAF